MPLQLLHQREKKETRETREAKAHPREDYNHMAKVTLKAREVTQKEDTHQEILPYSTVIGSIIPKGVVGQDVTSGMTRKSPLRKRRNCWPSTLTSEAPQDHLSSRTTPTPRKIRKYAVNSRRVARVPKALTVHMSMWQQHQRAPGRKDNQVRKELTEHQQSSCSRKIPMNATLQRARTLAER